MYVCRTHHQTAASKFETLFTQNRHLRTVTHTNTGVQRTIHGSHSKAQREANITRIFLKKEKKTPQRANIKKITRCYKQTTKRWDAKVLQGFTPVSWTGSTIGDKLSTGQRPSSVRTHKRINGQRFLQT